jgi:hypothetical protein
MGTHYAVSDWREFKGTFATGGVVRLPEEVERTTERDMRGGPVRTTVRYSDGTVREFRGVPEAPDSVEVHLSPDEFILTPGMVKSFRVGPVGSSPEALRGLIGFDPITPMPCGHVRGIQPCEDDCFSVPPPPTTPDAAVFID